MAMKSVIEILSLISHLYPAMFAAITSVSNCNVKTKPGNMCSNNITINNRTTAQVDKISISIGTKLLRTYCFAALKVAAQPFQMATSRIQSKEEQRLFVSLLTTTDSTELLS